MLLGRKWPLNNQLLEIMLTSRGLLTVRLVTAPMGRRHDQMSSFDARRTCLEEHA
jgi:hypothetical protein